MIKIINIQLMNACSNSCWFCPPFSKECKDPVEYINMDKIIEFISYGIKNNYIIDNADLGVNRCCDPMLSLDANIEFIKRIKSLHKDVRAISIIPSNNLLKTDIVKAYDFFKELEELKVNIYRHQIEPKDFDTHIRKVVNYMLTVHRTKNFIIKRNGTEMKHVDIMKDNGQRITRITIDQEANLKTYNILKSRGGSIPSLIDTSYIRDTACETSKSHFGIDSNGNIMPCCEAYSRTEMHRCLIIGNIYTDSFEDIYQTIKTKDYIYEEPCKHCLFNKEDLGLE